MSDRTVKRIKAWTAIGGLVLALIGMFGAFYILPYRVDALEAKAQNMEHAQREIVAIQRENRERLIRIEERMMSLQENLKRAN